MKAETFTVVGTGVGNTDYAAPKPVGQVPVGPIYTLTDMAELAARLDSPMTFDRRGTVVWLDAFGGGIQGVNLNAIWAGTWEWSTEDARFGGFSIKVMNPTGPLNQNVGLWKNIPYRHGSRMGVELGYKMDANCGGVSIGLHIYDGAEFHWGGAWWTYDDSTWWLYDAAGGYFKGPTQEIDRINDVWQAVKLVVDVDNNKYVRMLSNGVETDLSGHDLYTGIDARAPYMEPLVQLYSSPDGDSVSYFGYVIATENEPDNL